LRRFPDLINCVRTITLFGTKRTIRVHSFGKFINIDLLWNTWGRAVVAWHGYLPKGTFGKNTDAESDKTHLHCKQWIKEDRWVDPDDGFDYGAAALVRPLPPILSFAGRGDAYLGHPADVERFLQETGAQKIERIILGVAEGFKRDYDHVSMIKAREAPDDHFPTLLNWLRSSQSR
jgi:predicted alpha/beta hydrolase